MKRVCTLLICFLVLFSAFPTTAYAMPTDKANAIQQLLDDAVRISGTPGISVAVIYDNQVHFFNSGHTSRRNQNDAYMVNEHTLYEIGSLSKAFTAMGILLLEEQGLLSITDRIEDHLPWFYLRYQNEVATVTIQHLLNHTSGLSDRHQGGLRGEGPDMLRRTVEQFVGAALCFSPGTSHAYNNNNYNILGLIIEVVSGQSYEAFMTEQVLEPLGMYDTFLYHSEAIATGRMAQGHRNAFFMTLTFDAPVYGGMKPTGFIISSTYDMVRWMGIHLGLVQDIPDIFLRIVERVHQGDIYGVMLDDNLYYSAGWLVRIGRGLSHAGGTPSFMSNVLLFTEEEQGVVFLANASRNIDFELAWFIKDILDGDLQQTYSIGLYHLLEIVNSIIVIIASLGIIILSVIGIRNRLKEKPQWTKAKVISTSICVIMVIFTAFRLLNFPNSMGAGWAHTFDWNPLSNTIQLIVIPIFCVALAWFNYTKKPKEKK